MPINGSASKSISTSKESLSDSSVATGRRSTARGKVTVERLLSIATEIFCSEGYGEFTMRRVASASSISLSNLQFYFKKKEDLLSCVIDRTTGEYLEQYRQLAVDTSRPPTERLEIVLRRLLDEVKKPRVQALFINIWALAQTHEFARDIVERIYSEQREVIAGFVRQINPKLTDHDCSIRAALISSQVEGLMVLIPQRTEFPVELKGVEEEAIQALIALAGSPSREKAGGGAR
jgi:AcrR family transcriptional regulator